MERPDLCLYNSDKDTIDHGAVVVDFDNDVVATYTMSVISGFTNRRMRVGGTKAVIDGDLNSQQITICYSNPVRTETIMAAEGSDMHGGADFHLVPDFFAFMDGKTRPKVTPEEAMVSVRIGLAATESSDTGRTVKL
jgi:predicted dehydrogenase